MPRRGENIRKRKDGRWEGRYIKGYDSAKGKAKYASIYGKTYSEVKKKMNEAKFQTSIGRVYVDAKNMLFGEIVNNWFGIVKINLKPSSINKYQNLIENHVLPELGHYKLKDLNSDTLHGFLEKQGSTGNKKNGGSLSISTLQTLLYILNSSIKYAASNNMITLFSVHLLGGGKSAAPISCLSEKDESALDTYLSAHLSCRNMGIMLSLYCGLRIGEVCGLQWADIDFEHKLISIKRTVQRIKVASGQRKTKLWVGTPKSKSSIRTIPIPDFLMSALYALSAQSCSDAYILTQTDEPLDPRTLQYYFNKVTISCGIGKINYHILRHTFATNCVALGFDIKTLSEILGHSNVSITLNKYVHPSIQQKTIQMASVILHGSVHIALGSFFRFFQSVVVQFIIEAVFKVMVGGNQIAGSHALLVAVNHLRCQPFWFVGNHFIQLTHLGNLCMAVACPQMLFAVLSCTKEVFAVHTQTV